MKLRKFSLVFKSLFIACCCCCLVCEANAGGAQQGENCTTGIRCGDGDCQFYAGETHANCPLDCSSIASCGDGICSTETESCTTCSQDCGQCTSSTTSTTSTTIHATTTTSTTTTTVVNGCGDPKVCSYGDKPGDYSECGKCPECVGVTACGATTTTTTCPTPTTTTTTMACCDNDGVCEPNRGETVQNCVNDCGNKCGNGTCDNGPNCPTNCPTCNCTPGTETAANCPLDCKCTGGKVLVPLLNGTCKCPTGQVLTNGVCACPTGQVLTNGVCACPTGQVMTNNVCKCSITGQTIVNGACKCPDNQMVDGSKCVPSGCPAGQIKVGTKCIVPPVCDNYRGTTAKYMCVAFSSLSNCKGVSKGVSRHAYGPDGKNYEVWCYRGSNQGLITPIFPESNVICACVRVSGCFHPDTQISLSDGTTKKAKEVTVQDSLLNPVTGKAVKVLSVVESKEQAELVEFGFEKVKLKVSEGHAVLVEGGKLKKAKELVVGDKVLGADKKYHSIDNLKRLSVESGQKVINFNLETDSKDTNDHMLLSDGIATGDLFVQGSIK